VGEAVKANSDMAVLMMILIDRVRMLLMLRYAPKLGAELIVDLTDTEQQFLADLAKDAKSKINSETLRKLLVANIETGRSPVPQLPLELAIMELAGAEK
jgi:indole-3-glycerol phosphate synthase